jgi:hypothetical protein
MRSRLPQHLPLALALLAGSAACGDGSGPSHALIGTWELASYSDHGVLGVTTGTMVFQSDGSFEVQGTVTYPGEPSDSLNVVGTWTLGLRQIRLTTGGESAVWSMVWQGEELTLTLEGPLPTNVIVLRRPGS